MYHTPENSDLPWTEGGLELLETITDYLLADYNAVSIMCENSTGLHRHHKVKRRGGKNYNYSAKDIAIIKMKYRKVDLEDLAKELGRDKKSIYSKVLSLRRSGISV